MAICSASAGGDNQSGWRSEMGEDGEDMLMEVVVSLMLVVEARGAQRER